MYSEALPAAVGEATRKAKGEQICGVLARHGGTLSELEALDYGCSTGLMTAYFATRFRRVVGVDVDEAALRVAAARFPHVSFRPVRALGINDTFDVVVANQIYNCVSDQTALFDDLYRLLKPGGVCFVGARNKYALIEAQYHLPFLSMLPAPLARSYLRLCRGTSTFVGPHYRSRRELLRLAHRFRVHDYTLDILRRPEAFGFAGIPHLVRYLPLRLFADLIPNFVLVLERE